MIETDFLRKECARETEDEQAALYAELYEDVMAEREAAGFDECRILASAEAGRRLREELKKEQKPLAR